MRLVIVVGRTCSGKSTLARALAKNLDFRLISVGEEIRKAMRSDEHLKALYAGANGFTSDQVVSIVKAAYAREKQSSGMVLEGSIGVGSVVQTLLGPNEVKCAVSILLECAAETRRKRFSGREKGGSRSEHKSFFDDRENLFDRRLPDDMAILRGETCFVEIDATENAPRVYEKAKSAIDAFWNR